MALYHFLPQWWRRGQTEKKFSVPCRKTYATQAEDLQEATQKAFKEIAAAIDTKEILTGEEVTKLPFKI